MKGHLDVSRHSALPDLYRAVHTTEQVKHSLGLQAFTWLCLVAAVLLLVGKILFCLLVLDVLSFRLGYFSVD